MLRLKKFDILSTAKVMGVIYGALGLLMGAILTLFSIAAKAMGAAAAGVIFGIGAIILLPLLYGAMGFITGAIGAWIYNLCTKWTGGITIETEVVNKAE